MAAAQAFLTQWQALCSSGTSWKGNKNYSNMQIYKNTLAGRKLQGSILEDMQRLETVHVFTEENKCHVTHTLYVFFSELAHFAWLCNHA